MNPIKTLWCAVILQALDDAVHPTDATPCQRDNVRDEARRWFDLSNDDFTIACDLAGVDAKSVHAAALMAIARGEGENFRRRRGDRRGELRARLSQNGVFPPVTPMGNRAALLKENQTQRSKS